MTARTPDHPIENLFVDRWSPRAFDRSTIEEADLKTILEAARWSPSAFNIQPWRFVYARRGDADWQVLVDLLNPFNRDWAQHASALVYLFSDSEVDGKDGKPNRANGLHTFDAGSAWAHAALQATALGFHAHGMAGILKDEIHENSVCQSATCRRLPLPSAGGATLRTCLKPCRNAKPQAAANRWLKSLSQVPGPERRGRHTTTFPKRQRADSAAFLLRQSARGFSGGGRYRIGKSNLLEEARAWP